MTHDAETHELLRGIWNEMKALGKNLGGRIDALKGEIVASGFVQHLGIEIPVFPKRRFQHGATDSAVFQSRFRYDEMDYRAHLLRRFAA